VNGVIIKSRQQWYVLYETEPCHAAQLLHQHVARERVAVTFTACADTSR
jgi:hypothetical protein